MQILTDLFNKWRGKAEQLVDDEIRDERERRIEAKTRDLAASEERAEKLKRLETLKDQVAVHVFKRSLEPEGAAIGSLVAQLAPHIRSIEAKLRSVNVLAAEALALAEDLGAPRPCSDRGIELVHAWGAVSALVAQKLAEAEVPVEMASDLARWILPDARQVIQAVREEEG